MPCVIPDLTRFPAETMDSDSKIATLEIYVKVFLVKYVLVCIFFLHSTNWLILLTTEVCSFFQDKSRNTRQWYSIVYNCPFGHNFESFPIVLLT
jgi:hypothetical protein